jgi:hypothetical protein
VETPAQRPRPTPPPVQDEDRPRRRRDGDDTEPPPRSRPRREEDDPDDQRIRDRRGKTGRQRDEEEEVEEVEEVRSRPGGKQRAEEEEDEDRPRRKRSRDDDEEEDYDDRPARRRRREEDEEEGDYDDDRASRKEARRRGKASGLWFLFAAIATIAMLLVNTASGVYVLTTLPQLLPNAQLATTIKVSALGGLIGCGLVEVIGAIFQFMARSSLGSVRGKGKVITAIVFAFIFGVVYAIRVVTNTFAVVQPAIAGLRTVALLMVVVGAAGSFFNLFAAIKGVVTLNNIDVKRAFRRR